MRIEPNLDKNSKYQLFRQVIYREKRPPLYDDTLEFIADSLFKEKEVRVRTAIDKIVYAKTLEWEYESEYRFAIPVLPRDEPWDTLPYHPEEITELYLGLAMEDTDRNEIVGLAKAINPNIMIFRAKREADGKIAFDRV